MTRIHSHFDDDDMLTVADAARVAQRSVRTIRRAYLSSRLVAHRDGNGRSVRIQYAELRAWLTAEVIRASPEPGSLQRGGGAVAATGTEGREKTEYLQLLTAARARRTRAAGVSSAGRPAGGRGSSRTA
jgi:excisionase family DNA binding protein